MHLFTDYVQPLTLWLHANPSWALLITGLISFTESLAIIGSIIPGSVTMTAIGILAGSGVLDIGFTFFAATLGAVAGDSASYTLGYIFSDHLENKWPFRRYPEWLQYGKAYFARHGGKSVIIGRFFGPLRSIIPVIAGMLHMNQWYFLFANIVSAIGWALLYVMPGVLIGAASSELSTERATRLFMLILALLVAVWLVSIGMQWVFRHASHVVGIQLNRFWDWAAQNAPFRCFIKKLSPKNKPIKKYATENLLITLFVLLLTIGLIFLVRQGSWVAGINKACYLFLQSLRTQSFDAFFIVMGFFIHPLPLLALALCVSLYTIYSRDWRLLRYWISLVFTCSILTWVLTPYIYIPIPQDPLHQRFTPLFTASSLTFATALFGFLISYAQTYHRTVVMLIFSCGLLIILLFGGLAFLYLGDYWATSVSMAYLMGITLSLSHWILFRRGTTTPSTHSRAQVFIIFTSLILLLTTAITSIRYFKKAVLDHAPYRQQFVLTHHAWWNQTEPLLPVFTTNRIGQRIGLFNIQYLGTLSAFEHALTKQGWKKQTDSLFYSLLLRAGGQYSTKKLPLMAQLYLNKKPELIMTYPLSKGEAMYILRLWRSNYHLRDISQPIWLGSVIYLQSTSKANENKTGRRTLFTHIVQGLDDFEFEITPLANKQIKGLPVNEQPEILMMKESVLTD